MVTILGWRLIHRFLVTKYRVNLSKEILIIEIKYSTRCNKNVNTQGICKGLDGNMMQGGLYHICTCKYLQHDIKFLHIVWSLKRHTLVGIEGFWIFMWNLDNQTHTCEHLCPTFISFVSIAIGLGYIFLEYLQSRYDDTIFMLFALVLQL